MKFETQKLTLPIKNYDTVVGDGVAFKRHGNLWPSSIRGIIVGPSGCGKTNVLLSLLEDINGLRYDNVYVYSKSLDQPKYEYFKKVIQGIKGVLEPMKEIKYFEFSEQDQVISPEEVLPNSIMNFDDIALESQVSVKKYFTRGRHKDVDSFCLAQSLSAIPKQFIRDNCNLLISFRQDDLNTKHIYHNYVNTDMKFDQFRDLCHECWKDKHGFLVIDRDSDINRGRYRKGFHDFYKSDVVECF